MIADLLGVRSSKGRYYQEYRHSTHDLERTLMAVNALSGVLADAPGDARSLVESTLPLIASMLGARTVVLVSDHPALGGRRGDLHSPVLGAGPQAAELPARVVEVAERLCLDSPPDGLRRRVPELGVTLLLAPLPRAGRGQGYVVAALPPSDGVHATDLAILGTLTNQLAGAVESCQRLDESESSRVAADAALAAAAAQAQALARHNDLLRQARHDLVAARQQQVLAEERQRIARDLHDSLAQHVLSIGMQVEWCRVTTTESDVRARLGEVKEMARSTVERIRQAIFELSGTDEVAQGGLVPALRTLCAQQRVHGLTVSTRFVGCSGRLPAPVERAVFMAAKEAVFNAVLHSQATRVAVHLTRTADRVRLSVADDGQGRAAALLRCLGEAQHHCDGHHRGLVNVDERLRQVGGGLVITDVDPTGVRVVATVPTPAAPAP